MKYKNSVNYKITVTVFMVIQFSVNKRNTVLETMTHIFQKIHAANNRTKSYMGDIKT